MHDTMIKLKDAAEFIKGKIKEIPKFAIVLGSGLGSLASYIEQRIEIPYENITNFPHTTVLGHAGVLIAGRLEGRPVIAMKGRFHYYEGWDAKEVVFPIRVFNLLGINNLILTNAAGGVNKSFIPGDLMVITDHLGMNVENPLRGINIESLGVRFPDMSQVYDKDLVEMAAKCAISLGIDIKKGIYAYSKGPSFETPAEIRALRLLGADAVGMSTVPEAIAACHMRMRVLAISCITNMAAGILDKPLTHDEVMETGRMVEKKFVKLIKEVIKNW